ncbi:MAG TPA: tetratricopeptide repeat protein, partial [Thermoanaerobaculia bacterium]|nr:tetratricopeptide repeat protein [Thermoanaerobaculia bacterium]
GDADVRIEQLAAISDAAPTNLLVAQMLGTALAEAGRYPEAERVLTQGLERTAEDEEIIRAARVSATLDLDDVAVSTVIHAHHALGVTRLSQSSAEPPWISLKNVIGSVKPLSKRRLLGTTRGQPAWSRLLIAAPGCTSAPGKPSLSSYDLFNNLIVGYMRGKFTGTNRDRDREFARPQKNYPGALHKLLLAQTQRARANGWPNEAQLWALSNVEQVIDWRMPDDARLAYNSVQVVDWWTSAERCPPTVCTADLRNGIGNLRDELIEQALRRRNVTSEQQGAFARGLVGMLASSTLDRTRVANETQQIRAWLPPSQQRTVDDLLNADAARSALPRYLFAPQSADENAEPAEPPQAKLGPRADRWYAAAMTDVAASASRWASARPPREQGAAIVAIRQLLGTAEAPPELLELEQKRSLTDRLALRLTASKTFWATVAVLLGALIGFVLLWIAVHVRESRLMKVSLYNVEHEHLAGIDAEPGPGQR